MSVDGRCVDVRKGDEKRMDGVYAARAVHTVRKSADADCDSRPVMPSRDRRWVVRRGAKGR